MVQWQTISLPFGGGIDTRTDPKLVKMPKLLALENGVFTNSPGIRVRSGYDQIEYHDESGNTLELIALATRDQELIGFDDNYLYSYDEPRKQWYNRGRCTSPSVTEQRVANKQANQSYVSYARTPSGINLVAWTETTSYTTHYSIYSDTGILFADDVTIASTTRPKAVASGNNLLLFYVNEGSTTLYVKSFLNSAPGTVADTVTVTEYMNTQSSFYENYALNTDGSTVYVAYNKKVASTYSVELRQVSQIGQLTGSAVELTTGDTTSKHCKYMSVSVAPERVWVAWSKQSGTTYNNYIYSTNRTSAAIVSAEDTGGSVFTKQITIVGNPNTPDSADLFMTMATASGKNYDNSVVHYPITNGTRGALDFTMGGVSVASSGFWYNGFAYCPVVHQSSLQSTYFVIGSDGTVISRMSPGLATDVTQSGFLPTTCNLGGDGLKFYIPMVVRSRLDVSVDSNFDNAEEFFADKTPAVATIDFTGTNRYQTVDSDGVLYISGGILWEYDGDHVYESGFLLYPEPYDGEITATAGNPGTQALPDGDFVYSFHYETYNARKQRTISASVPHPFSSTTSYDTLSFAYKRLYTTNRTTPLSLTVYRSTVDADVTGGAPLYRVSSPNPDDYADTYNGFELMQAGSSPWIDGQADAVISDNEYWPGYGGTVENIAPESPRLLSIGNGRLWVVSGQNRIWYSKYRNAGETYGFNDSMVIDIPDDGGKITALGFMNGIVLAFKADRIYAIPGDGPDNTLNGSFGPATLLNVDTGCTNPASVVRYPNGLLFQSSKGIYGVGPDLQVQYVGADVDAYKGADIRSATLLPDSSEVRFLTSNQGSIVFNYLVGQWSTFTGIQGPSSTLWQNRITLLTNNSRPLVENPDSYTDAGSPYKLKIALPWFNAETAQSLARFRYLYLLGSYHSDHQIRVKFRYNYAGVGDTTTVEPEGAVSTGVLGGGTLGGGYLGGGADAEGCYQFRIEFPQQENESVQVTLETIQQGLFGRAFEISELMLEIGTKYAPAKIPVVKNF